MAQYARREMQRLTEEPNEKVEFTLPNNAHLSLSACLLQVQCCHISSLMRRGSSGYRAELSRPGRYRRAGHLLS